MKKSSEGNMQIPKPSKQHPIIKSSTSVVLGLLTMLFMLNRAVAHPGHDHTANESMLVHVLFYGSILAVIAVAAWLIYRQFFKQKHK